MKTKKKVKQSRSLSRRRSGEVSFRKVEQASSFGDGVEEKFCSQQQQRYSNASAHYQPQQQPAEQRNQRWVHLPISICEALRSFGAEFSCLLPCKSSCFSTEREKAEKQSGSSTGNENGCGAVFARWLVSVNDGEGGKRREIELVVGGGDEEEERAERISMRSSRRHVFEDIEVKEDRIEVKGQNVEEGEEEEAARVSICIPPKNALLLMRCRSDPMKMADLAHRFSWDAHAAPKTENQDGDEEENVVICEEEQCEGKDEVIEQDGAVLMESNEEQEISDEIEAKLEEVIQEEELVISSERMAEDEEEEEFEETEELQQEILGNEEAFSEEQKAEEEEEEEEAEEDEQEGEEEEEEVESNMSSFEDLLDQENAEQFEDCPIQDKEEVEETSICHLSPSTESDEEEEEEDVESNIQLAPPPLVEEEGEEVGTEEETEQESNTPGEVTILDNDDEHEEQHHEVITTSQPDTLIHGEEDEEDETTIPPENQEPVSTYEEPKKAKENQVLPECLLLMMCEPKLSMEVSKETWVCSTDFLRWLPERPRRPVAKTGGGCGQRRLSIDSKPKHITHHAPTTTNESNNTHHQQQPPRSSCTLPAAAAAASMATMIEQKLVNAVGYEPFVLTRCKSEPMRTAAAKLIPESCFWKNAVRKLEPHRRATLGVGAAGVGF